MCQLESYLFNIELIYVLKFIQFCDPLAALQCTFVKVREVLLSSKATMPEAKHSVNIAVTLLTSDLKFWQGQIGVRYVRLAILQ